MLHRGVGFRVSQSLKNPMQGCWVTCFGVEKNLSSSARGRFGRPQIW